MKTIAIAGRLGRDAELRRTQGGDPVCGFSVAVDDRQQDQTYWFECSLWGKRGEGAAKHLTKGKQVSVTGDFSTRVYEGKTYLQIRVNDFALQGGGSSDTREDTRQSGGYGGGHGGSDLDGGDIPF